MSAWALTAAIVLAGCGGAAAPSAQVATTPAARPAQPPTAAPRITVLARPAAAESARRAAGRDASVVAVEPPAPNRLARVAAMLDQARALYRDLAFEESLGTIAEASVALGAAPDTAEARSLRHQVLVLRATNQIALGRAPDARASLLEAAQLLPDAVLEEARHPPDVRTLYEAAREQARQGGAAQPAPPAAAPADPDGREIAASLFDASYAAIADLPRAHRERLAADLDTDVLVVVRDAEETVAVDLATGRTRTALPGAASLRVLIGELHALRGADPGPAVLAAEEPSPAPRERAGDDEGGGILSSPWFWIATAVVVAGGTTAGVLVLTDNPGAVGVAGSGFE